MQGPARLGCCLAIESLLGVALSAIPSITKYPKSKRSGPRNGRWGKGRGGGKNGGASRRGNGAEDRVNKDRDVGDG